jgi:type VI secretion system protein ImpG
MYPEIVSPFPSCSIAKFAADPNRSTPRGHVVPRGTELRAREAVLGTLCRFRTAYDVRLWPLEIAAASLDDERRLSLRVRNLSRTPIAKLEIGSLRLHLKGQGRAGIVYDRLIDGVESIEVRFANRAPIRLSAAGVAAVGFRWPDEALIDPSPRTPPGLLTLFEFLHFPEKFAFVDVNGLAEIRDLLGEDGATDFELLFRLRTTDGVDRVDKEMFELGCTPIANVFGGAIEPRKLSGREPEVQVLAAGPAEFRVDLDNVRSTYHSEVYRVDQVAVSQPGRRALSYEPFLQFRDRRSGVPGFWHAERRPTSLRGEAGRASVSDRDPDVNAIPGTDVFITLTELGDTPFSSDRVLHVTGQFTNRHLARALPSAVNLDLVNAGPANDVVESVTLATEVTETRPPRLDDEALWRLVSLLSLSFVNIEDRPGEPAGAALRTLLDIQNFGDAPAVRQRIDSIAGVRTRQRTRRVWWPNDDAAGERSRWVGIDAPPAHALVGLVRGTEVTVVLNERQGTGDVADSQMLFGSVLDRYFRSLAGVNGFTETAVLLRRSDGTERTLRHWGPEFGDLPAL